MMTRPTGDPVPATRIVAARAPSRSCLVRLKRFPGTGVEPRPKLRRDQTQLANRRRRALGGVPARIRVAGRFPGSGGREIDDESRSLPSEPEPGQLRSPSISPAVAASTPRRPGLQARRLPGLLLIGLVQAYRIGGQPGARAELPLLAELLRIRDRGAAPPRCCPGQLAGDEARLCRCHPWSAGGVDEVPAAGRLAAGSRIEIQTPAGALMSATAAATLRTPLPHDADAKNDPLGHFRDVPACSSGTLAEAQRQPSLFGGSADEQQTAPGHGGCPAPSQARKGSARRRDRFLGAAPAGTATVRRAAGSGGAGVGGGHRPAGQDPERRAADGRRHHGRPGPPGRTAQAS